LEIIVPIDALVIHLDGLEDNDGSEFDPATNDDNQEEDGEMSSLSLKRH
jgi:hypothetical protein